jgi:hypothetical protein
MNVISGVFGLISDVYILIIPMPAVWKLNIRKEKKVGVYVIFSLEHCESASSVLVILKATDVTRACLASILTLGFRIRSYGSTDLTVITLPSMACQ